MKKIVLATRRPWNWKVFLVLAAAVIPVSFAVLPFAIHLQTTFAEPDSFEMPKWTVLVINTLVNALIVVALGGVGLLLANRIGLGLPFVEAWARREPAPGRFGRVVALAWIVAVAFVGAILLLQGVVFGPPMQAMFTELGIEIPADASTPPHYGFLAALSAGITEETLFRLFGLTLLAWLGSLLFHNAEGRPRLAVLWAANLLFAVAVGAAHLPTAASIGWPMNFLVISRTIVLNSIAGLAFGWLYWTFGLESAMLAHFLADVCLYTLIPLAMLPQDETARIFSIAGVAFVVALALVWAVRALFQIDRRMVTG